MRETEYRGKSIETKKWIYGGFHKWEKRQVCPMGDSLKEDDVSYVITINSFADWNMPRNMQAVEVMPDTVGQYIGRSDKNKKKIYEGDILLTDCWHTLLIVYFDEDYLQFRVREVVSSRENSIDYYDNNNNVKIEVVGNIYDNPEMLEVER